MAVGAVLGLPDHSRLWIRDTWVSPGDRPHPTCDLPAAASHIKAINIRCKYLVMGRLLTGNSIAQGLSQNWAVPTL